LAKCLSKECFEIVSKVALISKELNIKAYLVGGIIRDIVLKKSNIDIDVTIEGDGILFAKKFAQEVGGKLVSYERFMTATVQIDIRDVDFASTRKELYKNYGALPEVSKGILEDDIKRRDFTVNSMAFLLNSHLKGKIIDYTGGLKDLENGVIRVLHPMSFFEDPTRIFRGVRFAGRFDYKFDRKTKQMIKQALSKEVLKTISRERIANELKCIFHENNVVKILFLMKKIGLFNEFSQLIDFDEKTIKILRRFDKLLFKKAIKDPVVFLCGALLINTQTRYLEDAISILGLNKRQKTDLEKFDLIKVSLSKIDKDFEEISLYKIYKQLSKYSFDLLNVLACTGEFKNANKILTKFKKAQQRSKITITGKDLKNMGVASGRIYSEIFEIVREQKINGYIKTKKDQLEYLTNLF
jgi:tRNA nucleotidyltransferase (CCA-adding enzyme)